MKTTRAFGFLAIAAVALFALVGSALAGDRDRVERRMTLIDDDGSTYQMVLHENGQLKIYEDETGDVIVDFDFDDVADAVENVVGGLSETLSGLADMNLDFGWDGDDNRFSFAIDEQTFDIDIDLDELSEEINRGLAEVMSELEDIDFEEFEDMDLENMVFDGDCKVLHRKYHRGDDEDLGEEISELRDEISELQAEIKQLRRRQRH